MLSSYSSADAKVDKRAKQVDNIVFRQKVVIEFLLKERIREKV